MTAGLREVFDRWAASDNRPLALPVRRTSQETVTLEAIVEGLYDDHTLLTGRTADALRVPSGVTYAGATFLLWWARDARGGPQVRSYRAAAFLLADLDEGIRDRLLRLGSRPELSRRPAPDATGDPGLHVRELLSVGASDGS